MKISSSRKKENRGVVPSPSLCLNEILKLALNYKSTFWHTFSPATPSIRAWSGVEQSTENGRTISTLDQVSEFELGPQAKEVK